MKRKPFLAGNWKMNLDRKQAVELARALRDALTPEVLAERDVAVFPPFVYLDEIVRALSGSGIKVGAQNLCDEKNGAFTGEVSAEMLVDVGATSVLVGHSERRQLFGESDEFVNAKVRAVLANGMLPILCCGETLEERQAGDTQAKVDGQVRAGLEGVGAAKAEHCVVAYEPIWAIGTGHNATPDDASDTIGHIRATLRDLYGDVAAKIRIQYGGSVKPGNIAELMAMPEIDGALVGGASLDPDDFAGVVRFEA